MIRKNNKTSYSYDYDSFINDAKKRDDEKKEAERKRREEAAAALAETATQETESDDERQAREKKAWEDRLNSMPASTNFMQKRQPNSFMRNPVSQEDAVRSVLQSKPSANVSLNRTPEDALKEMMNPSQLAKYNEGVSKPREVKPEQSLIQKAAQALLSVPAGALDSVSRYVLQKGLDELEPYKDDEVAKGTMDNAKNSLAMDEEQRKKAYLGESYQPNMATDAGFEAGKMVPTLAASMYTNASSLAQAGMGGLVGMAEGYGDTGTLGGAVKKGLSNAVFMGTMGPGGKVFEHGAKKLGELIPKLNLGKLSELIAREVGGIGTGTAMSGAVNMGFGAAENGLEGAYEAMPGPMDYLTNIMVGLGLKGASKGIESLLSGGKLRTPADPEAMQDNSQKPPSIPTIPKEDIPKLSFKTANNKDYTSKNTALEKALKKYDDAILKIQDHFGTNELRTDELAKIKPELGIDLEELVSNITEASKKSVPTSADMAMKRAAGATSDKADKVYDKIKKKVDVNNPKDKTETETIPNNEPNINSNVPLEKESNPINLKAEPINTEPIKAEPIKEEPIKSTETKEVPPQFQGNLEPDKIEGTFESRIGKEPKKEPYRFEKDELEKTYQKNKGLKSTWLNDFKEGLIDSVHRITRPIRTLPRGTENAEAYDEFKKHGMLRNIISDDTIRTLKTEISPLNKSEFDLLGKKIMLDDFASEADLGNELPNKFTAEDTYSELKRMKDEGLITPKIQEVLDTRKANRQEIIKEYVSVMKDLGLNLEKAFTKENYFRHQVLEYANEKNTRTKGTGDRIQRPQKREFLQKRSGKYTGDINTDYLQAEYEVVAQMKYDIAVAKMIKNIKKNYDIAPKLKAEAEAKGIENWKELIPKGYDTWNLTDNAFYRAVPVYEKQAKKIFAQSLEGLGISHKDVEKALNKSAVNIKAQGEQYVMKSDIVKTLDNLTADKETSYGWKALQAAQNGWKAWSTGLNPYQMVKYIERNFSANADTGILNPTGLFKVRKAGWEIGRAMATGKFTPELLEFKDMGGFTNLLLTQDIQKVNNVRTFNRFADKTLGYRLKAPIRRIKNYVNGVKSVINFTEMVPKYAHYLDLIRQMEKSPNGMPRSYLASDPKVIKGLKTIPKRAFQMSNDLFANYIEVSEAGQAISRFLAPFFKWSESNLRRHMQITKNIYNDTELVEGFGHKALNMLPGIASTTAKLAWSAGKTAVLLSAFTTAVTLRNNSFPDELKAKIPRDVKNRLYLILGSDSEGNPIYFTRLGSLTDVLEWFGLGDAPMEAIDILNGNASFKDIYGSDKLKDTLIRKAKQPLNKILSSISPILKTPFELGFGHSSYPDITNSRPIKDIGQHLAGTVGLRGDYDKYLANNPTKQSTTTDKLLSLATYTSEADKVAYDNTKNLITEYKKKIGKYNEGYSENKRTDSLMNYKLALKYNDKNAIGKFKKQYIDNGGNLKGLVKSLKTLHPLYGLAAKDRAKFLKGLKPEERKNLNTAIEYYKKVLDNRKTTQEVKK